MSLPVLVISRVAVPAFTPVHVSSYSNFSGILKDSAVCRLIKIPTRITKIKEEI
jgi:hypothetical protein